MVPVHGSGDQSDLRLGERKVATHLGAAAVRWVTGRPGGRLGYPRHRFRIPRGVFSVRLNSMGLRSGIRHSDAVSETGPQPPWVAVHDAANAAQERQYRDPETGYRVFTEYGLRQRGECCGCGCRHCPWGHEAVPPALRTARITRPAWLSGAIEPNEPLIVVFWSGGKDSFLAARAVVRESPDVRLALLTTFGQKTRIVAHQELPIDKIVEQAEALSTPLLGVPLYPKADYTRAIADALRYIASHAPIEALVFGDLHLEHIRAWREDQLSPIAHELKAQLRFPLWGADYDALQRDLAGSGAQARICSSPDFGRIAPVKLGERFDVDLVARLPADVDAFGECGEFHTELIVDGLGPQHLR